MKVSVYEKYKENKEIINNELNELFIYYAKKFLKGILDYTGFEEEGTEFIIKYEEYTQGYEKTLRIRQSIVFGDWRGWIDKEWEKAESIRVKREIEREKEEERIEYEMYLELKEKYEGNKQ